MPTASESRAALRLVTGAAVASAWQFLRSLDGTPESRREALLESVPDVVGYYALGSSALAADFYDDERDRAGARGRFVAEPVIPDRTEKLRRAIVWAVEPLFDAALDVATEQRLAEVVQLETARPYRETITTNRRRDPESVGWRRISSGGCKFCAMLASRGAVYREETARFASHANCNCTAQPVFRGEPGEEADVMQYVASKRRRSDAESARLREYLNEHFPDVPG